MPGSPRATRGSIRHTMLTEQRLPDASRIPEECLTVLHQLWDLLDDQLPAERTAALRAHIASCPQCREFEHHQERFLEALAALRARTAAPPPLRDRVLRSLRAEGFSR